MRRRTIVTTSIAVAAVVCGGIGILIAHGPRDAGTVGTPEEPTQTASTAPTSVRTVPTDVTNSSDPTVPHQSGTPSGGKASGATVPDPSQAVDPGATPAHSPIREGQRPNFTFPPEPKPATR